MGLGLGGESGDRLIIPCPQKLRQIEALEERGRTLAVTPERRRQAVDAATSQSDDRAAMGTQSYFPTLKLNENELMRNIIFFASGEWLSVGPAERERHRGAYQLGVPKRHHSR